MERLASRESIAVRVGCLQDFGTDKPKRSFSPSKADLSSNISSSKCSLRNSLMWHNPTYCEADYRLGCKCQYFSFFSNVLRLVPASAFLGRVRSVKRSQR